MALLVSASSLISQLREKGRELFQYIESSPTATTGHHRKLRSKEKISVIPCWFGPISGAFLLTAWFACMIGLLKPLWGYQQTLSAWTLNCYRLFRKAPPWVMNQLTWRTLYTTLLFVEYILDYLEQHDQTMAILQGWIDFFIWCHKKWIKWTWYIPGRDASGKPVILMHPMRYQDLKQWHRHELKMDRTIATSLEDLFQCHPCGTAFPFLERNLLMAVPGDTITKGKVRQALTDSSQESHHCTLVCDTGASQTCVGVKEDFQSLDTSLSAQKVIKGIAEGLEIAGEGIVEYTVQDSEGAPVTIRCTALYVPGLGRRRLLSPQGSRTKEGNPALFITPTHDESDPDTIPEIHIKPKGVKWTTAATIQVVPCGWHPRSDLPTLNATVESIQAKHEEALFAAADLTVKHNENLSDAQKTLLMLHYKLGHLGFKHIQWLVSIGKLKVRNGKKVQDCEIPKCAACLFGKMTKRAPSAATTKQPKEEKEMALKAGDLLPGQRVSMDHYECRQPGRLYGTMGGSRAHSFCGGAIFVDHATGYVSVQHQITLGAADTIQSKIRYERAALEDGVIIQGYHTDNGVFTAKEFMEELLSKGQNIRFSGAGAGHQNGVAERSIRTVVGIARTMMLHAALRHGSGMISQNLWPQAMDHAVWLYNRIPQTQSGLSPLELWTRSTAFNISDTLNNCHVWGCPVFVLDPKLRKDGVKIPKWAPRSKQGVNLGFSRTHSSLIALVLNTKTHSITPQFHVVFDDSFSTVPHNGQIDVDAWRDLITSDPSETRIYTPVDDMMELELADEWLEPDALILRQNTKRQSASIRQSTQPQEPSPLHQREMTQQVRENSLKLRESPPSPLQIGASEKTPSTPIPSIPTPRAIEFSPDTSFHTSPVRPPPSTRAQYPQHSSTPVLAPPPPVQSGRPQRNRTKPMLFDPGVSKSARTWKSDMVVNLAASLNQKHWHPSEVKQLQLLLAEIDAEESAKNPVYALTASKAKDPDAPNLWQAMSSDEHEEWMTAMRAEIKSLQARKTWKIVERIVAGKEHVIPGTWSFKKKRLPDGTFRKYKARWCKRGDIERKKAGPSLDTYSPVVSWSTVRMMLLLGLMCGLKTKQLDYTNAFAQADLPEPAYMELPEKFKDLGDGFEDPIIELHKSLYGGALAAKHWFNKLKNGLEQRGFRQSTLDPCLFIRSDMIIVTYIDDCIHWYRDEKVMEEFTKSLDDDGDEYNWEHTVEGQVSAFLGIDISYHKKSNRYKLTQTGLIDKVLKTTGMTDCNGKPTPCRSDAKPLGKDADGPPAKEKWSYSSVVGMLLYLAGNSRPDIAFAVNQCGRFTHDPKQSHEEAVLRICRYLKGTRDDGLIFQPGSELKVDCYVDADFGGLFGVEDPADPSCAKSRTGYVIMLANCPLIWASKLQNTIALSTQNAEYVALSQSLRELVAIRELILDLVGTLGIGTDISFVTKSKAFEDNAAALQFAKTGKLTLQNKHIATKYHWFRSHIHSEYNQDGWLDIEKIESDKQAADIFTKNLTHEKFVAARQLLCGW